MAKYILCLQRRGKFEGKQVIPEEWAAAATTKRVDCKSFHASSNFGYGYGFWMNPVPDSFRANGLFSQFGISFDRYNAILICDSAIIKEEDFRQIIWRHFPAAFIEKNSQNTVENYNEKLASFVFERLPQKSLPIDGNEFGGKIMLKKNFLTNLAGFPTGALPSIMTAKMSEKTYPIAWAEFVREGENILFKWREGKDENAVALGADGEYKKGKIKLNGIEYITLSSAEKTDKNILRVDIRYVETIARETFIFKFSKRGKVRMTPISNPPIGGIFNFLTEGAASLFKSKILLFFLYKAIGFLSKRTEPVLKGKREKRG